MLDVYVAYSDIIDMSDEGKIILPESLKAKAGDKIALFYSHNPNDKDDNKSDGIALRLYNEEIMNQYLLELMDRLNTETNIQVLENLEIEKNKILSTYIGIVTVDNEGSIMIPQVARDLVFKEKRNIHIDGQMERGIPYVKVYK